jgi:hypothetical protein
MQEPLLSQLIKGLRLVQQPLNGQSTLRAPKKEQQSYVRQALGSVC